MDTDMLVRFPNLVLRDHREEQRDLWSYAEADTLEGIYFGMLRRAMEESPENAPQIQLAAEISRKLLQGREIKL